MDPAGAFRAQAAACRELGSAMYAELLDRAAADIEVGGPVAAVLAGHRDDPGPSALGLRLLGSVHRLVLERRAGELATFYPSVGGTWEPDAGGASFLRLVGEQPDAVREWLDRPPQTNEVGRAGALYGGLLHLSRDLSLRLCEIGCSAGLNLNADRFGYTDEAGDRFGAAASELVLDRAWLGRRLEPWPGSRIVERRGSDIAPVDVTTTEGRLVLTAYVWPDQQRRLERLRAALAIAAVHPIDVRRQDARSFVDELELRDGATTVLWHSVMWQYLTPEDRSSISARIQELGSGATDRRRLAHLRAEPSRRTPAGRHEFLVRLRTWPGEEDRVIGHTVGHGVPTTWE